MEVSVAALQDITPGRMKGVEAGDKKILIANVAGQYYAIGNTCTHMGCTVSEGTLKKERVQCPCHGSTFDVRTGAVVKGPAENPEPSYKLRIEKDQIFVTI
jgi:nitrite reductase/ring-hydroxylating ferredoxin subunit